MRIDQEGQVIEDDPKLGKNPLGHGKCPVLITLDGDLDISLAPEEKPKGSQDEKGSNKDKKNLFPLRTQVQISEKEELIEGNKERKDGCILLGKNTKQIAQDGPAEIKDTEPFLRSISL